MRVAGLQIAPVKGLAVVPCEAVTVGQHGIAEDRRLFLLTEQGAVVTLRRFPRLSQIKPALDLDTGTLSVQLPDGSLVTQLLPNGGAAVTARLFGRDRSGVPADGPVAAALSDFAGTTLRLVHTDGRGHGWDEGPVSVIADASVAAVRDRAGDGSEWARFRMTVTVEGLAAFGEEAWAGKRVRVGGVVMHRIRPLERCVVIERSPATGDRDWPGLKELVGRHRRHRVTLGIVGSVAHPGRIRLGDGVALLAGADG